VENNKPKVLIVDDEKGLRTGTQRLLQKQGYEVDTAENGTTGIELGTINDYDLAIIDLKMPDIDGIEVLKEIKKCRPNTICFIATAFASFDTAIEATKVGAQSYIPKPFTSEELIKFMEAGYEKRLLLVEADKLKHEREERMLEIAFEKSRLSTIVNSIVDGVIVVNKTGELVLFNTASLKYFELNEIIIGEEILGIFPDKVTELIKKFINSDKYENVSYSVTLELKPNRELCVEVTCSPVPHPDGSLAGVVIVLNNITELKKIEFVKSQFVSMVAHELKAPVAAVLGFMNLILDDSLNISPEQGKEYILRSSKRLRGLVEMVNDLLDISRMEIKKKEREIKELNIAEILKSTVEFLELELKKKSIKVNLEFSPELPLLKADSNEINRLFTNIISNAMKYNKENGSINISVIQTGNYLVTKISDTGIGMKPEEKKKLFQEFYRIKNSQTKNIPGTGLGLSIVKRIVESYSGKIDVESEFGKGTTFIIYLPIKNKINF
jgi:two-component system, OmpR family, phosphate regulon sensor histidine kinase PhoR